MNEPDSPKLITRQLRQFDCDQVMKLATERFSVVFEYEKVQHKNFVTIDQGGFQDFKKRSLTLKQTHLRTRYLNKSEKNFKAFGTFEGNTLLSMVEMKIISDTEWMLEDLKAKDVRRTGLRETMCLLYQTAIDLGMTVYYAEIAAYRYEKFQKFMQRLVPEYYGEYQSEIIETIPAGSHIHPEIPAGMMGHTYPLVDVVVKKMTRWISE